MDFNSIEIKDIVTACLLLGAGWVMLRTQGVNVRVNSEEIKGLRDRVTRLETNEANTTSVLNDVKSELRGLRQELHRFLVESTRGPGP